MKKILHLLITVFLFVSFVKAQSSEVTITLNEHFFDKFFEAVFTKLKNPSFQISAELKKEEVVFEKATLKKNEPCNQSIVLEREIEGVVSTVRFRQGKIYAPLAFSGNYDVPLLGCIEFSGWAETVINLEFDQQKQTLFGNVKVDNVKLSKVPNMAGGLLSRFVQTEIDKKINPVEILKTDKLSFLLPIQSAEGNLKMRAYNVRHEIGNGFLNVIIGYQFEKG